MRKVLSFLLVSCCFILILLSLTGCLKKKDSDKGVEILFYTRFTPDDMPLWEEAIAKFREKYPEARIKIENYPYGQYWEKLLTMLTAGMSPDVIFLESTRLSVFVEKGGLLPLNDYMKKGELKESDFDPKVVAAYKKDGNLYGLPNDIAIYAMFYNKNLFDRAGISYPDADWTWDDFLAKAQTITKLSDKDKIYGFAIGWTPILWVLQAGGDLFENNMNPSKSIINSPNSIKGFHYVLDLMYKHKVAPSEKEKWEERQ